MKSHDVTAGITVRTSCRVCGGGDLVDLFSLGTQWVNDFVAREDAGKGMRCPLTLMLCGRCGLVQLRHTSPPDWMYKRFYWYRSGVTETMRAALGDIAEAVQRIAPLGAGDVVLDIGSNDGTLLRAYDTPGLVKVGIEPALNFAAIGAEGVDLFINDYWDYAAYAARLPRTAKAITAIGMFYDMEDPNQFIADIASALDQQGLFVAQLMCLQNMLNIRDLGNICHEHLEYYSYESLEFLFGAHGLEIVDAETNDVNGESFRFYCRHKGAGVPAPAGAAERLRRIREAEARYREPALYQAFFEELQRNRDRTVAFIRNEVSAGRKVWVYGASSKGNVILQFFGLNRTLIEGAAERSPEKYGKYTVGSMIPIHSEDEARRANPDYFLVLPYAFVKEFIRREQAWLDRGGRFIIPLPEFRIVRSIEDVDRA